MMTNEDWETVKFLVAMSILQEQEKQEEEDE